MSHPRAVEVMDGNASFLCVYTCSEHFGRTEHHADFSGVHIGNHIFPGVFGGRFLNEADFAGFQSMILHQLALHFTIYIPFAGLIGAQVGENELRAFVLVEFFVITGNQAGAVAGLVIDIVAVKSRGNHTHIKRHFTRVIGGDKHFGFIFPFGQGQTVQKRGIARFCEFHQPVYELNLVGRGRNIMQYFVFLRAVDTNIGCGSEIGYFGIKVMGVNVID